MKKILPDQINYNEYLDIYNKNFKNNSTYASNQNDILEKIEYNLENLKISRRMDISTISFATVLNLFLYLDNNYIIQAGGLLLLAYTIKEFIGTEKDINNLKFKKYCIENFDKLEEIFNNSNIYDEYDIINLYDNELKNVKILVKNI